MGRVAGTIVGNDAGLIRRGVLLGAADEAGGADLGADD
jgi:hypothetical protein